MSEQETYCPVEQFFNQINLMCVFGDIVQPVNIINGVISFVFVLIGIKMFCDVSKINKLILKPIEDTGDDLNEETYCSLTL